MMRSFVAATFGVLSVAAWSAVLSCAAHAQAGAVKVFGGISQEISYTGGPAGVSAFAPTSVTLPATVTLANGSGAGQTDGLVRVSIENANRQVAFVSNFGDSFNSGYGKQLPTAQACCSPISLNGVFLRASDWTRQGLIAQQGGAFWRYQTFGFWQSGVGQTTGSIGGVTFGSDTTGAATPQVGSAEFTGVLGGVYVGDNGQSVFVFGGMGMRVDFAGHTADFWTSKMVNDDEVTLRDDLVMTGKFVSLPNYPRLFGTLSSQRLTGTSTAQFYGPSAEEVGGVFALAPKSGQGLERFSGAFGAARGVAPPPAVVAQADFKSWTSAFAQSTTVSAPALSREQSFAAKNGGVGEAIPDYSNPPLANTAGATFTQTVDAVGATTSLKLQATKHAVSFHAAYGDTIRVSQDSRINYARASDWSRVAIAADPTKMGWDYQSFGAWETGIGADTRNIGAYSTGALTPAAAIPMTGSATFTGAFGGVVINGEGRDDVVTGSAQALVTFGPAVSIAFRGDNFVNAATGERYGGVWLESDLILQRTVNGSVMTTASGLMSMLGTGSGPFRDLSGTVSANFFGPEASELGGTFDLRGYPGTVASFIGGFGLKR